MSTAATQNGRVWSRRLGVEFDQNAFEAAMAASGFNGSVLKGPLTLVFFKKIGKTPWGRVIDRNDRRTISILMGEALAKILRGEEVSILAALASVADSTKKKRLLATNSVDMISLIREAIAARTEEKSRPNLTNAILQKQRKVARHQINDDPEGYGI